MLRNVKLFVALMFVLAVLAPAALSQSNARIVRISDVEGQVDFDNGHGYESATINMPISEGNRLFTRADGWAEVQFEDGSTARLAPDTEIVFTELKRSYEGATITAIDLYEGEADFRVTYHDEGSFQVNARQKRLILRQSGRFRVRSVNTDPLELVVWRGEVGVHDPESGEEVAVKRNETFALDAQDVSRYDLEQGAQEDGLDQWSTQRDEFLAKNAGNGESYTSSPYQYGLSDLDAYGQYYDIPGYGYMWRPNYVDADWNPYANGYWCRTPWGFTWVSGYPWGWLPYRYGGWVFIPGYGWLWRPGEWHHWHRIPPIQNPPPSFHPPRTPPPGVVPPKITGKPGPVRPPRLIGPPEERPGRDAGQRRIGPPEVSPGSDANQRRVGPRLVGPPEVTAGSNGNAGNPLVNRDGGPRQIGPPEVNAGGNGNTGAPLVNRDNYPRQGGLPEASPGRDANAGSRDHNGGGRVITDDNVRTTLGDRPTPPRREPPVSSPPVAGTPPSPVRGPMPPVERPNTSDSRTVTAQPAQPRTYTPPPTPVQSYSAPPSPSPAPVRNYSPPPSPPPAPAPAPVRSYSPPPPPPAPTPVSHPAQERPSPPPAAKSDNSDSGGRPKR
jgi:hypothetical protein